MSAITDAGGVGAVEETLSDREIRALTERLVVLDRDAPGLFTVFSEGGTEYTVDIHDGGACTCPDVEFNGPSDAENQRRSDGPTETWHVTENGVDRPPES